MTFSPVVKSTKYCLREALPVLDVVVSRIPNLYEIVRNGGGVVERHDTMVYTLFCGQICICIGMST